MPLQCLPLSMQRMRRRWPDKRVFTKNATPLVLKMLMIAPPHITPVELVHGLMRQDLNSTRKARSFAASANRTLCKQIQNEHHNVGGIDLTRAHRAQAANTLAAAASSSVGQAQAMGANHSAKALVPLQGEAAPKIQNPGTFAAVQAKVQATFKSLVAPERPLNEDELARMKSCVRREWGRVQLDKDRALQNARAVGAARRQRAEATRQLVSAAPPFTPLFPGSDQMHPVPLEAIAAHEAALPSRRKLGPVEWVDPTLRLEAACYDTSVSDHWGISAFGCCSGRKICRTHGRIAAHLLAPFNKIVALLLGWTRSLGTGSAASMRHVAWLHCQFPADEPRPHLPRPDCLVLYIDKRERPEQIQYFIRCSVGGQICLDELPTYPFEFQLAMGPGLLCPR